MRCRQEIAAGEAAAARGRAGVEAKLGALTDRLLHMARKEAKREKRRGSSHQRQSQHSYGDYGDFPINMAYTSSTAEPRAL